jgi:hypothetical protein
MSQLGLSGGYAGMGMPTPQQPQQGTPGGANPYNIQGQIPFQAGAGALGDAMGGGIGGAYTSAYNAALSQNQAQYQNILGGYQQIAGNQFAAQQPIKQGYSDLGNQIQGTIANVGQSQSQAIADSYSQQSGAASQGLISSGLGNSTVQQSVQAGLGLQKNKADIALSNQMAQLKAGYQAETGMAGLGYANQANQQNTQLGLNQLGFMNSVQMQYPNAQSYQQLAQMQGMQGIAQQAMDIAKRQPAVAGPTQQRPIPPPGGGRPMPLPQGNGDGSITSGHGAAQAYPSNPYGQELNFGPEQLSTMPQQDEQLGMMPQVDAPNPYDIGTSSQDYSGYSDYSNY